MTQFTTQNNNRRRLTILLILGVLFLSPERGVRAAPESQPEQCRVLRLHHAYPASPNPYSLYLFPGCSETVAYLDVMHKRAGRPRSRVSYEVEPR